jgi:molecular chaperone GrpE
MLGIELIEKELINSFDKNGIKSFESMGKKFDPNFHQALKRSRKRTRRWNGYK